MKVGFGVGDVVGIARGLETGFAEGDIVGNFVSRSGLLEGDGVISDLEGGGIEGDEIGGSVEGFTDVASDGEAVDGYLLDGTIEGETDGELEVNVGFEESEFDGDPEGDADALEGGSELAVGFGDGDVVGVVMFGYCEGEEEGLALDGEFEGAPDGDADVGGLEGLKIVGDGVELLGFFDGLSVCVGAFDSTKVGFPVC